VRAKADLTRKVVIIAGGASGIGLALALRAAEQGIKVALADVDEGLLAAALEQVNVKNVVAITVRTDVSDVSAVRTLARRTQAEFDPPWLLCNTSGGSTFGQCRTLSATDLKSVTDVNLWAVINGVQVFAHFALNGAIGNLLDRTPPFNPLNYAATNCNPTYSQAGIIGRYFRLGCTHAL
jgi:NAD(P)-dependent dehydrogenase (short-subunit alcohol dehydrogenase family)